MALTSETHLPAPAWAPTLCILGSRSPGCAPHSSPCRGATWRCLPRVYFFLKYICRRNVAQLLSRVQLFVTPWSAVRQAPLFSTVSQSLLKLMSIESVIPFNHLSLCCPLLLLPSIFPSIRVFSTESAVHIRWPKSWTSASVLPITVDFL